MNRFRQTTRILLATLREIFDEAAYDRFLCRKQMAVVARIVRRLPPRIRRGENPPPKMLLNRVRVGRTLCPPRFRFEA